MPQTAPNPVKAEPRDLAIRLLAPLEIFLAPFAVLISILAVALHSTDRQEGQFWNQIFDADLAKLKAGQTDRIDLNCTKSTDALLSQLRGMREVEIRNLELSDATDKESRHGC